MQTINEYIQHVVRGETQFIGESEYPIGWQTVLYSQENYALGGGLSSSLETSKRIAVAEVCERKAFIEISTSKHCKDFLIDSHPTSCGFAAGFEKEKVKIRSLAEAVERWAWSKWIDDGYYLKRTSLPKLSKISQELIKNFSEVMFFQKEITIEIDNEKKYNFNINIFLGFKEDGIFPGSRVTLVGDCGFEHAIVEAFRHLMIFKSDQNNLDIVYERIKYFGKNKQVALNQINKAIKFEWPKFEILMQKQYESNVKNLYVYRTLPKNYIPWNDGPRERFVY